MTNIKNAKRAAAFQVCIMLHKMGEVDDNLKPKQRVLIDEDSNFLFGHYPKVKEVHAGNSKTKRTHLKQVYVFLYLSTSK